MILFSLILRLVAVSWGVTAISSSVRDASDFAELCRIWGYEAEEHIVQTKDGYLLGVHRLQWRRGEEGQKVNSGPGSVKKRVVYLHHGLLMNSEVWVCLTDAKRCIPFELLERGFDVWVSRSFSNFLNVNVGFSNTVRVTAGEQPREQVFEKVDPLISNKRQVLGFLHGRIRIL